MQSSDGSGLRPSIVMIGWHPNHTEVTMPTKPKPVAFINGLWIHTCHADRQTIEWTEHGGRSARAKWFLECVLEDQ